MLSIEEYSFADNRNLVKFNLPEGLVYIGEHAFYDCRKLENVALPSTLERIDEKAFYNCTAIAEITLGEKIREVADYAFYGCTALQKINMNCTNAAFGSWTFPDNIAEVYYSKGIDGWMTLSSKSGVLQNDMTLYIDGVKPTELIVPEGVTEIKENANAVINP